MGIRQETIPKGKGGSEASINETDGFFNSHLWVDFYHVASGQSVEFKAYLTDFSDQYESEWNEEMVYGRNDPLLTFEGTRRDLTVAWQVLAEDPVEAFHNMKRVSLLINMLYPHYDVPEDRTQTISSTSISASPLLKIRMMNWIQDVSSTSRSNSKGRARGTGLLGKVDGLEFSPNLDEGMIFGHEVGNYDGDELIGGKANIDQDEVDPYKMYPKEFELSVNFTVNHQHPLGWNRETPRQENFPYGEKLQDGDYIIEDDSESRSQPTPQSEKSALNELTQDQEGNSGGSGGGGVLINAPLSGG